MLMPGRYIWDTAEHCAIMTQTMMVPQWVSVSVGVNPGPVNMIGGAVPTWFSPTSVSVFAPAPMFGLSLDMSGLSVNGSSNISYSVTSLTGTWQASVVDSTGNTVASQAVQGTGSYSLDFVPASTTAQFQLVSVNPGGTVRWASPTYKTLTYVAGTVTSLVCNGEKDRYRFGYNGQEKDNEIAGVGNFTGAEFWEYSTQIGRRLNLDPITNSSTSPYSAFKDNPLYYYDIKGDSGEGPHGECPGDIRTNPDGSKEKYDGKTWQAAYNAKNMHLSDKGREVVKSYDPWGTKESNRTDGDGNEFTCPFNDCSSNATVAYGHLIHKGPLQGPSKNAAEKPFENGLTKPKSEDVFNKDVEEKEGPIHRQIKVPLTQNEFDALVIASFNGAAGKALFKIVNSNEMDPGKIRSGFEKYARAKNQKTGKYETLKGLKIRADATAKVYSEGIYSTKH